MANEKGWEAAPELWNGSWHPNQGSTGVLKTSRLPTWVVNFGVGFAHPKILLDAVLRGQPTCHNFVVRASIFALDCTCSC